LTDSTSFYVARTIRQIFTTLHLAGARATPLETFALYRKFIEFSEINIGNHPSPFFSGSSANQVWLCAQRPSANQNASR